MTIKLLEGIQLAGVHQAVGSILTLAPDAEARHVSSNKAVYTVPPDIGDDAVPVTARKTLTGGILIPRTGPQNTMCVLGDSFIERCMPSLTSNVYSFSVWGTIQLTNMLLGQRFNIVSIDGQSGTTSASFLTRLKSSVLDHLPRYAYIQGTVNDILSGTPQTLQQSVDNYSAMFAACNKQGCTVITNTVPPFTGLNTAAKRTQWNRFNAWLMNVAPTIYDVIVLPNHYTYLDPALLTCQPVASAVDVAGTHPQANGAYKIALENFGVLDKLIPGSSPFLAGFGAAGEDDALHPNPINVGATGVKGSNVTGSVSTTMQVTSTGNLGTVVASKVARSDGPGQWQQIEFTPSAANQICTYQNFGAAVALGNAAVGDEISLFVEYEIDAATPLANVRWVGAQIDFVGTALKATANPVNSGMDSIGAVLRRGVIQTPKFAIPAGCTGFYFYGILHGAGNGLACTTRFGQAAVKNWTRQI